MKPKLNELQWAVLLELLDAPNHTATSKEISERIGEKTQSIGQSLSALERKELIRKVDNPIFEVAIGKGNFKLTSKGSRLARSV